MTQPIQPTQPAEPTPVGSQPGLSPVPTPQASGPTGSVAEIVARQDLARRLGIPMTEVKVINVSKAEMPIGSLGCGETDGTANTGLIVGSEITLSARSQEYVYHSDGIKLAPCSPADFPGGSQPIYLSSGGPQPNPDPQESAIADLAGRLSISTDAITVRSVEAVKWPDASLGCAKPGRMYAQVITPGYRIVLQAGGKSYEYHTGAGNVVLCQ